MKLVNHFFLHFFLFCIGLFGLLINRQNLMLILLCIELMLLSINLNFLFFSLYHDDIFGEVCSLYILTVAAAESAIGLAIIISFYNVRGSISITSMNLLSR